MSLHLPSFLSWCANILVTDGASACGMLHAWLPPPALPLSPCRALAVWLQKVDPKTDGAARDWVAIYDECSRILYQEINCE